MDLDLSYLKEMSAGDEELIVEMIDIFTEQINLYQKDLMELYEKQDYIGLGKLAHKAKSSISVMGLNELAVELKELEENALEGKALNNYKEVLERFNHQTNLAMEELKKVKQDPKSLKA
jgi:HPt (histidine-containing phosphotransfer) domain-containing protein